MKKRSIVLLLSFILVMIFTSCNGAFFPAIEGNGNRVTKSYDVSEFSSIDASHAFIIEVVVGETQSVKVETDDNLLEHVKIFVRQNTLHLDTKNNTNLEGDIKVIISAESLSGVDLSGACKIDIENIASKNFTVDVSGACKGVFSGTVKNLNLDLSGATKLNTVELKAENLNADMSGASNLKVYCSNTLNVDGSGASKITVYGNPKTVKTDFSGASSINFK